MDPKLMAILKKAKAVDSAAAQKSGEKRTPTRNNTSMGVDRSYFDGPETEYLTAEQVQSRGGRPTSFPSTSSGGGGLFDQMGISDTPTGGGVQSTPLADRMSVESPAYETSVKNSGLPPAIQKAMLESPIPQPNGLTDVPEEFIKQINPGRQQINERTQIPDLPEVYSESDERDFYDHPIQPKVQPREIPRTQPQTQRVEHVEVGESEIRKMIAQEIAKALPKIIEAYFDKRVLKENVQFKAGETTFSGTVSPLPKKRTKRS
jgi:hypothetical protein